MNPRAFHACARSGPCRMASDTVARACSVLPWRNSISHLATRFETASCPRAGTAIVVQPHNNHALQHRLRLYRNPRWTTLILSSPLWADDLRADDLTQITPPSVMEWYYPR